MNRDEQPSIELKEGDFISYLLPAKGRIERIVEGTIYVRSDSGGGLDLIRQDAVIEELAWTSAGHEVNPDEQPSKDQCWYDCDQRGCRDQCIFEAYHDHGTGEPHLCQTHKAGLMTVAEFLGDKKQSAYNKDLLEERDTASTRCQASSTC